MNPCPCTVTISVAAAILLGYEFYLGNVVFDQIGAVSVLLVTLGLVLSIGSWRRERLDYRKRKPRSLAFRRLHSRVGYMGVQVFGKAVSVAGVAMIAFTIH